METKLTRREWVRGAGLTVGGVLALKVLPGCGDETSPPTNGPETPVTPETPPTTDPVTEAPPPEPAKPTVKDFPYEQHLQAGYQLDAAVVREAAYHGYYEGGCCHGAYKGLLEHLAKTAGAPFDALPLDFGRFGGGGVAGYGSICGAVLGSVLVTNMIVADTKARAALMTQLMRWYETYKFPQYVPTAVDAAEKNLTKSFAAANMPNLQHAPGSHLCHASVSSWCTAVGVSATGGDKLARCARLTADVAGKCAELLNAYLTTRTATASPLDAASATCVTCHTGATANLPPVASGMTCGSCHTDKLGDHP